MEEVEPLYIATENVKWYSSVGKQFGSYLRNKTVIHNMAQQFYYEVYTYPKELQIHVHIKTCTQMITETLFIKNSLKK